MFSRIRRLLLVAPAVAVAAGFVLGFTGTADAAKYRIGFTVGDMGNPFHTRVWKTAQAVAQKNDVDLILLDTKRDLQTESNNIDLLIAPEGRSHYGDGNFGRRKHRRARSRNRLGHSCDDRAR